MTDGRMSEQGLFRIFVALAFAPIVAVGVFGAYLEARGRHACAQATCPAGLRPVYVQARCVCGVR